MHNVFTRTYNKKNALHPFSLLRLVTFTKILLKKNIYIVCRIMSIGTNTIALWSGIATSGKYLSNIYTSQSGISIIDR